jgi:hypothetical protein
VSEPFIISQARTSSPDFEKGYVDEINSAPMLHKSLTTVFVSDYAQIVSPDAEL